MAVDEHFNDSTDVDVELTDEITGTDTAVYNQDKIKFKR